MTDYDDVARQEKILNRDHKAAAEVDEESGPLGDHPFDYVDSESLASYNLRRIRTSLGISQQQIADRLPEVYGGLVRLAQTQIAKIERGVRPWRMNEMFAIAEALGVNYMEFFRGGPKDEGDDDSHLILLGARNKYTQRKEEERRAREAWREAASESLKAGLEMVRTAAELGIKDPAVMHFLETRHSLLRYMDEEEARVAQEWGKRDIDARIQESRDWAEREWEIVLAEAQEAKKEEGEQEKFSPPPFGKHRRSVHDD
jgi:transcriptional regulator with XRE-family HTH domain